MEITFLLEDENRHVAITNIYDIDTPWPELIGQFNSFLSACSYVAKEYNNFVEKVE